MKKLSKKQIIFIAVILAILGIIYYHFIHDREYIEENINLNMQNDYEEKIQEKTKEEENSEQINKIVVYIVGEVQNQGIYEMFEGSRIADVIEKAGGITEQADIKKINLAYTLEDGMKIYIPNKDEELAKEINEEKNNINNNEDKEIDKTEEYISKENDSETTNIRKNNDNKSIKININTATQTELETLPGIGPSIALKICKYREENGKFTSIENIKNVNGIGDSKYAQIKDYITI